MFKPGDKVVCLNPDEGLEFREIYTVRETRGALISLLEHKAFQFYHITRFTLYLGEESPAQIAETSSLTLPIDSAERKNYPLFRGCLRYFPAALAGVSNISKAGNDKHNPGEEMHHARGKSRDHGDCIIRHLIDAEDLLAKLERETFGVNIRQILKEVDQMAWRALAYSQELHERFGAPLAPGAKLEL